jgi:chemotaxis methyl-accepting protein methylase
MALSPYRRVVNVLQEHSGADVSKYRKTFRQLFIAARKRGFKTPFAYVKHLEAHVEEELPWVLDHGLVHTTAFGRDAAFWQGVYKHVVAPHTGPLRVLSLGCSSGAELATIALVAMTKLARCEDFTLDAWDISPGSVAKAQSPGFQRRYLARLEVPAALELMQPRGKRNLELVPALQARINARVGDVRHMVGEWWGREMGAYDLVLCRNLLTYLDEQAVKEVLAGIWVTGKRGGFLGTGKVDPVPPTTTFELVSPLLYRLTAPR